MGRWGPAGAELYTAYIGLARPTRRAYRGERLSD